MTRYFDEWMKFHSFKEQKANMKQASVSEHRKRLLKSSFDKWKRRVNNPHVLLIHFWNPFYQLHLHIPNRVSIYYALLLEWINIAAHTFDI